MFNSAPNRLSVKREVGAGVGFGFGVGVSFLHTSLSHFFFLLTQILISRNLHQLCIVTIFSGVTKINKIKCGGAHFFRITPKQSNTEAANFFSSSTPISVIEVHK